VTNFLLGGILAFAVATAAECYLLLGRVQLLFNQAELILRALHTLLREVPTKSAQQTLAAIDEKPRPWFQTLRRLADLREHLERVGADELEDQVPEEPQDVDVELARWADDGGQNWTEPVKEPLTADLAVAGAAHTEVETEVAEDQTPTESFPRVPATEPVERVDLAGGLRLPPEGHEPDQLPDDESPPIVDDVDLQLVRWGLRTAEGHRP
jgi:hypothetical protein